jgi:hypothetical protein
MSPIESALVVLVPEAEVLVKPFRDRFDPLAAAGVPAHITLLYPFKHPDGLPPRASFQPLFPGPGDVLEVPAEVLAVPGDAVIGVVAHKLRGQLGVLIGDRPVAVSCSILRDAVLRTAPQDEVAMVSSLDSLIPGRWLNGGQRTAVEHAARGADALARFPALVSTMRALRLPKRASAVAYLVRFRRPRLPPVSCPPQRSRKAGGAFRARALPYRLPKFPGCRPGTRMGSLRSLGNPSRAFAAFLDRGRVDVSSPWRPPRCCPRDADDDGLGIG